MPYDGKYEGIYGTEKYSFEKEDGKKFRIREKKGSKIYDNKHQIAKERSVYIFTSFSEKYIKIYNTRKGEEWKYCIN